MNVTDVRIRKIFERGPLAAICSLTLDNCIAVHDIKIISVKGKTIVAMPSKKRADGEYSDIVHPINSDVRVQIEHAVINEYKKVQNNSDMNY